MITDAHFEAFLKCETKSYLKFTEVAVECCELLAGQRETQENYRTRCRSTFHSIFPHDFNLSGLPSLDDLRSARLRFLFDCTVEANGIRSHFDLVEKVSRESKRKYSGYIPIRFVANENLTKQDKLLLAFDAIVLGAGLGKLPPFGKIMHGTRQHITTINLSSLIGVARAVVEKIVEQERNDRPPQLILNRHCVECGFRSRCHQLALEKGELSLLPRMTKLQRQRLHDRGIFSIEQLSYTFRVRRKSKRFMSNSNMYLHSLKALAIRKQKTHIIGRPELGDNETRIFLDVEGIPDRAFYYAIGVRIRRGDSCFQHSFWADDESDEKGIWRSLVRLLCATQGSRLIHYGSYESTFFRHMAQRYPEVIESPIVLDQLAARSLNLLKVISTHIYFPTYSNGLKEIAQHLGFRWSEKTPSGILSLMLRRRWELTKDLALKERLLIYNAEDCAALETVFDTVLRFSSQQESTVDVSSGNAIPAESLRNDEFHRFGRVTFSLPELDFINKAAYWDYQRNRIYVRSSQQLKRISQKSSIQVKRKLCPNKTVECPSVRPGACPRCHATKIYKYGKLSRIVFDLKLNSAGIKRWIVKYRYSRFICWHCKSTFVSREALWTRSKYGANFVAYILYNIIDLRLSQAAVARILGRFFSFDLCRGAVNNLKAHAAHFYEDCYKQILKNLGRGKLVHADETKISIEGRTAFIWVFTNLEEVAYVCSDTRANATPKALLQDFGGVLVSDFYAGYESINCRQQKCLIHLIRDLNDDLLKFPFDTELKELAHEFVTLLTPMIETVDRFGLKARFLRKHLRSVDRFYRSLTKCDVQSEVTQKYRRRFDKHRDTLFTFLEFDGIPWNNNNAEHAIKALADLRNVIGGTSSPKGILEYLVLLSISQTCKYRGLDFVQFVRSGEKDIERFAQKFRQHRRGRGFAAYEKRI